MVTNKLSSFVFERQPLLILYHQFLHKECNRLPQLLIMATVLNNNEAT